MENHYEINRHKDNRNPYESFEEDEGHFYFNETVDVFDLDKGISSEAIITSIRGDIFIIKNALTNEEEIIRNKNKLLIHQCNFNYLFIFKGDQEGK